jgi:hypothetical protein
MSIRNKLLAEINKKAQKIREKRVDAASNKTVEQAAFDFFKNIEDSRKLHNDQDYDHTLVHEAKIALENRLKSLIQK